MEVSVYDDCKAALYYIRGQNCDPPRVGPAKSTPNAENGVYIDNNNTNIHNAIAMNCRMGNCCA